MLICISGKKRSGKDTIANYLCKYHGYTKAPPFAIFKTSIANWFDWDARWMEGEFKEKVDSRWGVSPRRMLQIFGTELCKEDLSKRIPEFGRVTGNAIWARIFSTWYIQQDADKKYVVADMRFPIEAQELSQFDNIIYVQVKRENASTEDSHESERYFNVLPKDYIIENNSTLEALYDIIDTIVERIK